MDVPGILRDEGGGCGATALQLRPGSPASARRSASASFSLPASSALHAAFSAGPALSHVAGKLCFLSSECSCVYIGFPSPVTPTPVPALPPSRALGHERVRWGRGALGALSRCGRALNVDMAVPFSFAKRIRWNEECLKLLPLLFFHLFVLFLLIFYYYFIDCFR